MGHDPEANKDMQDWYSCSSTEEIIDEQLTKMPDGPLGVIQIGIQITTEIPSEAIALWNKFLSGNMDTFDFLKEAETIRRMQSSRLVPIQI